MTSDRPSLTEALAIADDAWHELRRSLFVHGMLGSIPARLPDVSFAETQRRSSVGHSLVRRMDALDWSALPHDIALTLRVVRFRASIWAREEDWYWISVDPLGAGIFGLFLPTAYCGGFLLNTIHGQLAALVFRRSEDTDHYLSLLSDYARLIHQFVERTEGQAARGIYMPKEQVRRARALMAGFKAGVWEALRVDSERLLRPCGGRHWEQEIGRRINEHVEPAFDRMLAVLSDTYVERAPERVGIGQYGGGRDVYHELVKFYTTLDLTPEEVHALGHLRMTEINVSMQKIRTELGFEGDGASFLSWMAKDPRWSSDTTDGVAATFQRYIDRLEPRFGEYFSVAPRAKCGVAPLARALQGSMTYGYYDPPRHDRPEGRYFFNPANLTNQALLHVGSLTYHELMPGHHLQSVLQQENDTQHPFLKYNLVTAYNEGWAEYAATLAGEIGLYERLEERYGRLMMEAFFTSRLVVDTGMNVLGWSLEQARKYMREHSGMSEMEILSDAIRYSCDIPAQALAYKIGDAHILRIRERVRATLDSKFDWKAFHDAILGAGALPLLDLEWHVERTLQGPIS